MKTAHRIIIAFLLVAVGFMLGLGYSRITQLSHSDGQTARSSAVFSGDTLNFGGKAFTGAKLDAVFGGVQCDVRGAIIENDCVINVNAVFGGVDILLPDYVNVTIDVGTTLGGVSDNTNRAYDAELPTVHIVGRCVLGGINVK